MKLSQSKMFTGKMGILLATSVGVMVSAVVFNEEYGLKVIAESFFVAFGAVKMFGTKKTIEPEKQVSSVLQVSQQELSVGEDFVRVSSPFSGEFFEYKALKPLSMDKIRLLKRYFPHMTEVIEILEAQTHLMLNDPDNVNPFALTKPIILEGKNETGKSYFINSLANIINTNVIHIGMEPGVQKIIDTIKKENCLSQIISLEGGKYDSETWHFVRPLPQKISQYFLSFFIAREEENISTYGNSYHCIVSNIEPQAMSSVLSTILKQIVQESQYRDKLEFLVEGEDFGYPEKKYYVEELGYKLSDIDTAGEVFSETNKKVIIVPIETSAMLSKVWNLNKLGTVLEQKIMKDLGQQIYAQKASLLEWKPEHFSESELGKLNLTNEDVKDIQNTYKKGVV